LTFELFEKFDTTDPKFDTELDRVLTAAKAVSTLFNPFCTVFKILPTVPPENPPAFGLPTSVAISSGNLILY